MATANRLALGYAGKTLQMLDYDKTRAESIAEASSVQSVLYLQLTALPLYLVCMMETLHQGNWLTIKRAPYPIGHPCFSYLWVVAVYFST